MKNLFLALIVLLTLTSCKGTLNDCLQAAWDGDDKTQEVCCTEYTDNEEDRAECNGEKQ